MFEVKERQKTTKRWSFICVFLCVVLIVLITLFFAACTSAEGQQTGGQQAEDQRTEGRQTDAGPAGDAPLQIVTTIFPEYDWVKNIIGNDTTSAESGAKSGAEVSMLMDTGVDLHSYQPTPKDIVMIANCDLFIYVGGESDEWVEDALKEAGRDDLVVINLMEALGDQAKEEEIKEGMQGGEEEPADAHSDGAKATPADAHSDGAKGTPADRAEDERQEAPEYDEHIWLSPRNAELLCPVIEEAIASLDPGNADLYASNLEAYLAQIKVLDKEYAKVVQSAPIKTLLFADRFPFRYLTEDYGLDYYAAFAGCSAETGASFETILFLARKVDELGLTKVCVIDHSDQKIAKTIIRTTKEKNQKILTMNSMQSVTAADIKEGTSWLSIMEQNLQTLAQALQ